MKSLLQEIRSCEICKSHLPLGPRPIVEADVMSRIVIVGQAPGTKVHESGKPWDDASGRALRSWLDVSEEQFYDTKNFAIIPMGFCYPGKGKSGDLPPRPECAPQWHAALMEKMPNVELILLIGSYAQKHYLENDRLNLTQRVNNFKDYLPDFFPLPHPSPRNRIWMVKNAWFEEGVVPELRSRVRKLLL